MAEVKCLLGEAAGISRHEPAILTAERRILYHELEDLVLRGVAHLRGAGISSGEPVALWLENSCEQLALILAIIRAGGVAVPLSTRWPAALVVDRLRDIRCVRVITEEARAKSLDGAKLKIAEPANLLGFTGELPPRDVKMNLHQPAAIVFTSGSSGAPRAAQLSYGSLYYSATGSNRNIRLASHDRWMLTLPLCHVGGLGILFRCLQAGATIVIPKHGESIEAAQAQFRATHLSLVPTQLYRLVQSEKLPASFASVKAILLGGSAINPALLDAARELRLQIFSSYGLTEMASQVTTTRPDSPPDKRATSGKLLRNRDLILADDGEILVCGDTLFQGYIENGKLRDARDANGWFHTGDLGSLDADGYLTVLGRKDSMFISGGENIHPEEVESALLRLGDIEQAVVVPVDDKEFGQRPIAFIRTIGRKPSEKMLSLRLGEWLPKFKIPLAYFPWPDEFTGELSKPDRRRAAALAAKLWRERA